MTLAHLHDDHVVYVPGVGETTVGAIRESVPVETPAIDAVTEASMLMWEDIATRNLCRAQWDSGVSLSDVKACHALRSTKDRTLRRFA